MVHAPYRGGEAPALTDMIRGQVQVMFATAPGATEHIKIWKIAFASCQQRNALGEAPS
jgi:tripartite-type tricarboxylate transporter receptor subunit TctC